MLRSRGYAEPDGRRRVRLLRCSTGRVGFARHILFLPYLCSAPSADISLLPHIAYGCQARSGGRSCSLTPTYSARLTQDTNARLSTQSVLRISTLPQQRLLLGHPPLCGIYLHAHQSPHTLFFRTPRSAAGLDNRRCSLVSLFSRVCACKSSLLCRTVAWSEARRALAGSSRPSRPLLFLSLCAFRIFWGTGPATA